MSIYLTGSIAYDRIMNFPGRFTDSILPDQIHNLNVSFFIDRLDEQFGGNAGNIAYTLNLLGERSVMVGTVGRDFDRYAAALESRGLSLEGVLRLEDELSPSAYIMTDQANNQITGFHAAAMMTPSVYDFPDLDPATDIALVGPSNPDDMKRHPALYREKGVRYIYDPSQQLPILSAQDLRAAIEGAYLLVGNDYEISLIMNNTGLSRQELVNLTGRGVITTLGEKGSLVSEKDRDNDLTVEAVPVAEVLDPTGAGDAYRAGLIKGLLLNQPLEECARLGASCAAFCIERKGTQGHDFSIEDFFRRHSAAFGRPV
ncbi:carbohydrate kinase family protein [Desulfovibrio sp. OttesenSCG-928-G11]|nr:carbohydrate kinase family protein [Desulfovibrio sp. OttesenSCG-928-G11]